MASQLPDAAWYSAAESALTAIYTLHPAPEHLSAAILRHLARRAFAAAPAGDGGEEGDSAASEQQDGQEGAESMEADVEGVAPAAEGAGLEQEVPGEAEEQESMQPADSEQTGAATGAGAQAPRSMYSVVALTRFLFALGHVALQHLVSMGSCAFGQVQVAGLQVNLAASWHIKSAYG